MLLAVAEPEYQCRQRGGNQQGAAEVEVLAA